MLFPEKDEPFVVFRKEYWLRFGMLEIEMDLSCWALPLSIYFDFGGKYINLKLLCLCVSFGMWQVPYDSLFAKEEENAR